MFRLSSLGHHQVISVYRGNCTIYDTIPKIKSLLFNEISFFISFVIVSNTTGMAHLKKVLIIYDNGQNLIQHPYSPLHTVFKIMKLGWCII
jgi:hypothetical protein